MKKIITLLITLAAVATITTGCAINRATATVDPSANIESLKKVHVTKQEKDERGIDVLIANKLQSKGYAVTTGPVQPTATEAVVTYVDKWMWDITMYMLELTISFRDPKSDYPLATGNSYHTSLTRKSPTEMVDEVVDNILKKGGTK